MRDDAKPTVEKSNINFRHPKMEEGLWGVFVAKTRTTSLPAEKGHAVVAVE